MENGDSEVGASSAASPRKQMCTLPYPEKFMEAEKFFVQWSVSCHTLSTESKLILYALAQQALNGPCTQKKPWVWNTVESSKWQAWTQLADTDKMEAMRLFVKALEEEEPDWYSKHKQDKQPAAVVTSQQAEPNVAVPVGISNMEEENCWKTPWVSAEKHPHPRYEHSTCILGNSVYVLGGNCAGGRYLADVWQLNVDTLEWTCATSAFTGSGSTENGDPPAKLPPSAGMVALPHRGRILVIGGHTKDKSPKAKLIVRVLDPARGTWCVLPCDGDIPTARGGHGAVVIGDKVYVVGGEDPQRRLLDGVHVLDLSTGTWSAVQVGYDTIVGLPSPRSAMVVTSYQDRYLVLFGGGSVAHCHQDVWILDTHTNVWDKPAADNGPPAARAGCAGAVLGNKWYIVGGGNNTAGCPDMWALDLTAMGLGPLTWEKLAEFDRTSSLASEGLSVTSSAAHGVLIAFGGYNGTYHNAVSIFRPTDEFARGTATTDELSKPLQYSSKREPEITAASPRSPPPQAPAPVNPPQPSQAEIQAEKAATAAANEAAAAREAGRSELGLMRRQLATAQAQTDIAEAEAHAARTALASERDRALQLEVQSSELQAKLETMHELEAEVDKYKTMLAETEKKGTGLWGFISGS